MTVLSPGVDFSELILNFNTIQFPRRKYSCNKKVPSLFSVCGREGGGRREEEGGGEGNSLAVAMNVPCATSHSNASKLDAVFVDQCFVQCLLA